MEGIFVQTALTTAFYYIRARELLRNATTKILFLHGLNRVLTFGM